MNKTAKRTGDEKRPVGAILFELENIAAGARQVAYNVIRETLAEKDVDLTLVKFSRYCLDATMKDGIARLLKHEDDKKRFSEEKMVETLLQGIPTALLKAKPSCAPAVNALVKMAEEKGVVLGALSHLSQDGMQKLAAELGLTEKKIAFFSSPTDAKIFPTADAWLKLAKHAGVRPSRCVVLTTSMYSCKSALSAGMMGVAIPDAYSCFQDYSGADCVADGLDKEVVQKAFELLEQG